MTGWDFTSLVCVDPTSNTTVSGAVATINLASNETVTCTYTNTKRGTIIVNKTAVGGDATFAYTTTGGDGFPANFNITTSGGSGSQTFNNIVPGSYSVAEAPLAGWTLTGSSCSTGTPDSFTVAAGATVTCTFNNTKQNAGLTLVKTATPSTYDSVGDVIGYSYLVTNSGNVSLAGPVTVTDDKATDEACPNVNTVGNLDGFLDPGESITCTASYTITQADLNAGSVTNTAQAHAGGTDSNTDTETVLLFQSPSLTLVKTATPQHL
jgi:hypothetical protein